MAATIASITSWRRLGIGGWRPDEFVVTFAMSGEPAPR
jgi:hypothetical protein